MTRWLRRRTRADDQERARRRELVERELAEEQGALAVILLGDERADAA